jgi:hypothetical protein
MLVFSYNLSASSSYSTSKVGKNSSELWTLEEGVGELENCIESNIKESRHAGGGETYGEHWRVIESFRAIKGH